MTGRTEIPGYQVQDVRKVGYMLGRLLVLARGMKPWMKGISPGRRGGVPALERGSWFLCWLPLASGQHMVSCGGPVVVMEPSEHRATLDNSSGYEIR